MSYFTTTLKNKIEVCKEFVKTCHILLFYYNTHVLYAVPQNQSVTSDSLFTSRIHYPKVEHFLYPSMITFYVQKMSFKFTDFIKEDLKKEL